eukprot:1862759-Rhodomonas_salina.1
MAEREDVRERYARETLWRGLRCARKGRKDGMRRAESLWKLHHPQHYPDDWVVAERKDRASEWV